jgi:TfoX/Sxy family transcriptional regulator of competence genes
VAYVHRSAAASALDHNVAMAYSEELADRVRERLAKETRISEREMFGGLGIMWAGNMICGVQRDGLLVRIPADLHHDALTRPHVREMEMGSRTMKGFVIVGHDGLDADADLDLWVRLGLTYAKTFPPKGAKKAAKKIAEKKRA